MIVALLTFALLAVVRGSLDADTMRLSFAVTDFSQDLYVEIGPSKHNIVYSPYGLHSALTMTMMGARGQTKSQMNNTLKLNSFKNSTITVDEAYQSLISQLADTNTNLYVGNAIYVKSSYELEDQFKNNCTSKYSALTSSLSMGSSGVSTVNEFVENKTNEEIEDILSQGSLNSSVALIVVSGVFFGGRWLKPFHVSSTALSNFYMLNGTTKQISMMFTKRSVQSKFNIFNSDVVELPFRGDRMCFYIVLPRASNNITNLESSLAIRNNVGSLFSGLTSRNIAIKIPLMTFESTLKLSVALDELGIFKAFEAGSADLSGISYGWQLHITEVIHKTKISIKESGTVGPNYFNTTVDTLTTQHTFTASRPFIFYIRDKDTRQILYHGKFSG